VVISGAGFAGLNTAKALSSIPVDVPVITRRNYHLFQPVLCQVATAGLPPAEIAMPIRAIARKQRDATVLLCRLTGINRQNSLVEVGEQRVSYDFLIVATGARRAYFGHDEWERVAPGLKKSEDATDIRRNILIAFERGETVAEPQERRRPLNFVVTGGGSTGVDLAGAIVELARKALAADFRNIDPHQARVTLIEANPRLLAAFPETLSKPAKDALEHLGVEVRLGMAATVCNEYSVVIAGERIEAAIIWAASVAASSAAKWFGAEKDRVGRGIVGEDLTLACLLWGDVHVLFLIGFRNRVVVLFNWLLANFAFERGSRLITTSAAEE
jgi:NADH:ubiquinone reductase (H+-translocating)